MRSPRRTLMTVAFVLLVQTASTLSSNNALADEQSNQDVDIIVLVDESTSLSQGDVEEEQAAVRSIINLPLLVNQSIRLQVLPFSSGDGSPRPLDQCDFTELDPAGVSFLDKNCPSQIRREPRTVKNGPGNTDFASAIDAALESFDERSENGRRKAILLLTDGKFDPSGNGEPTTDEVEAFDSILQRAAERKVQIWPLGFGDNVDFFAMLGYASKGFQGEENCLPPRPEIVDVAALGTLIYTIVGSITCSEVPPVGPTPSKIQIHPLVDRVSFSVFDSESEPTLQDPDGKIECSGKWDKQGNRYLCQLEIDGSSPGSWTVFGPPGSQVVSQISGTVKVEIVSCGSQPALVATRADGNKVDWNASTEWPEVQVMFKDQSGVSITDPARFRLSTERQLLPRIPEAKSIHVTLAENSPIREVSLANSSECQVISSPTTDPDIELSDEGMGMEDVDAGNGDVKPTPGISKWLLVALAAVSFVGLLIAVSRRNAKRRFTAGTIIKQTNPNSRAKVDVPDLEPAGRREIGIRRTDGAWLYRGCEIADAQIILRRDRDEVVIRKITDLQLDDQEFGQGEEEVRFPINLEFTFDGATFIVEVQEEMQFDETEWGND
jgi:hypothetical protein